MTTGIPVSPLRYPGAKRWMAGYISRSIERNDLFPELFVEPFAGGASVAIAQLSSGLVRKVILNDVDPMIAAFWQTLFFDTKWLVDRVESTNITLSEWRRQKSSKPRSRRGLAFKCLYLNRTSFSGVLTDRAGPIGGQSQSSEYAIDCRFNKPRVIRRIEQVASLRSRVAAVWNLNWRAAMTRVSRLQRAGRLPETVLYYLDPPFYRKASSLYRYYFDDREHVRLRDFLVEFDEPWILSYDACQEVLGLYRSKDFRASDVNLIYTASQKGKRSVGKEIIVSNLPRMVSELQLGIGKRASGPKQVDSMTRKVRTSAIG
jgi:DNA adenine methylase